MNLHRRGLSSAAPGASVRRYLSEGAEKEALRALKEQLLHQKRVTSDDVRLAVRAVASQGGIVPLPPDFPPSRWVLEFKRAHGFVQFNSFVFGAAASSSSGGKTAVAFGLPERLEVPPLRSTVVASKSQRDSTTTSPSNSSRNNINEKSCNISNASAAQIRSSSLNSGDSNEYKKEKESSQHSSGSGTGSSVPTRVTMCSTSSSGPRAPCGSDLQRHRKYLRQQQQRRTALLDERRRAAAWSRPTGGSTAPDHDEMQSSSSSGSESGTTTGPSNSPSDGGGDVGPDIGMGMSSTTHHTGSAVSDYGSSVNEMQDTASNASSSNDKRSYRLSHTVPAETWEKAIAAVEQKGMSLRAAAKTYGVHFAALHRRVKKRAQGGQAKGSNGYFHPSDEAGIMRVVVARAELGVLMTFEELMRLVEAAALRKLPDISVDSARKLLTRFQSRNEQSIRHIIVDWPPPLPVVNTSSRSVDGARPQHQPYLEHPGFNFGPKSAVILRSSAGTRSEPASIAAMAAAAKTTLFVPPSRLDPLHSKVGNRADELRRPGMRIMNGIGTLTLSKGALPGASNNRLLFVGTHSRSEGDGDAVLVV